MKFNPNGFLVQEKDRKKMWRKCGEDMNYFGVSAFSDYPLCNYQKDIECKNVQYEVDWIDNDDGSITQRKYITSSDLLNRYVAQCKRFNIPLKYLFLESEIEDQVWNDPLPKMKFIGYEYCECPFDCQVITDLIGQPFFQNYRDKLNEYGLFSTLEDALSFKADYDKAFAEGIIGDGDMETFIFRISEVEEI